MEQYRVTGRGSFNHNMNDRCNQNRQMTNSGRQMANNRQLSMSSRAHMTMSNNHSQEQCDSCSDMHIMPIMDKKDFDCKDNNHHMSHMTLGMGYVPMQEWGDIYDLETAHCQGTIFPDLNFVFCGARGKM